MAVSKGGVPVVLRDAPLGTYLGWNITAGGELPFHEVQICNLHRRDDSICRDDGRASGRLRSAPVAAVQQAADDAVAQGFLLQADANTLLTSAQASKVLNP